MSVTAPIRGPVAAPASSWLAHHRYGLLAAVVLVLTGIQTWNGQWSTDMWEHTAAVRELIAHTGDPLHPQVLSDAPSPSYSPYLVVLGGIGNLFGLDAVTVLSLAGMVNIALLLVALRAVVVAVTANERAPFWALLFVLLLWGTSPYRYSGFFNLNSIGFVAPYPSTFATAVALGTIVAAIRYATTGGGRPLVLVALGTALVVLTHPPSAVWLPVALLAVAISHARDVGRFAWLAGASAVAGGLCLLWPYYPLLELVRDSSSLEGLNRSMYTDVLARIAPTLLGLVVIARRSRADHRDLLGLLLVGAVAVYAIGGLLDNSSLGRSLALIVLVLQIALADGVGRFEASTAWRSAPRAAWVAGFALGGLLLLGVFTTRGGLVRMVPEPLLPASVRSSERLVRPDERYAFLADRVGSHEVVIATRPADLRVLPAITGRVLLAVQPGDQRGAGAAGVPRPFIDDADARSDAQLDYLDPATSPSRRRAIEEEYRVRYVLLHPGNRREDALLGVLRTEGATVVHHDDELTLVELGRPG